MSNLPGVFTNTKKNGDVYYRSSVTYKGKHISLGSFESENDAHYAYCESLEILEDMDTSIHKVIDFLDYYHLSFEKCVTLINFRDHNMYISNPIYISKTFFYYYLSPTEVIKFDADELFFYSSHKIMRRGNHLFVSEYGSQISIHSRYGIRPHAVIGRDYNFKNGDSLDYRATNIEILNTYYGVLKSGVKGKKRYKAVIHVNGNVVIGYYDTPLECAIAYNKAADIVEKSETKKYPRNTNLGIDTKTYELMYSKLRINIR